MDKIELVIRLTDQKTVNASLFLNENINILSLDVEFTDDELLEIYREIQLGDKESLRKDGSLIKKIIRKVNSYQPLVGRLYFQAWVTEPFIKKCEEEVNQKYPGLISTELSRLGNYFLFDSAEEFLITDQEYYDYISVTI